MDRIRHTIRLAISGAALPILMLTNVANGEGRSSWEDLPQLLFQPCVNLRQQIQAIPDTPVDNDYRIVTAYEEKSKRQQMESSQDFLNVYLVGALVLIRDGMGIYHNSQLIVDQRLTGAGTDDVVYRKWVLSDRDHDGVVDHALFQDIVRGADGRVVEMDAHNIPEVGLKPMQEYFKDAIERLDRKRKADKRNRCVPV